MKKISKAFSLSLMGTIAVSATLLATTINQAPQERERALRRAVLIC